MAPIAVPSPPMQSSPSPSIATSIPRRPSPWHEISQQPKTRRQSSATSLSLIPSPSPSRSSPPSPAADQLSSSALREWHHRLSLSSVQRHQLASKVPTPKLAAERDREGNMEYKLKLIDPTPERFERLVTQMMWRLREGGGEAIYEIGLADDGTVVGLTRAEMDESLRTLELMASEVGGTVLILKEIVLVAPQDSRPDRDHAGLPSKSLASSSGVQVLKGRRHRARSGWLDDGAGGDGRGGTRGEREVVFDQADLSWNFSSEDEDSPESRDEGTRRVKETDDDVSTFHLDLDEPLPPSPTPSSACNEVLPWRREMRKPKAEEVPEQQDMSKKAEAKRLKSFQRRENRRLDLLRGDGKSPLPYDLTPPIVLPHQPARPSSLRLANPPNDACASDNDNDQSDLLHILSVPLDNLSLSFADVRTVSSPPLRPSTSGSETEHASDVDDPLSGSGWIVPKDGEEERICVEALVVRKAQGEMWEFGGSEDGWGFGRPSAEEDDDGEVEWVGESEGGEDGWGFWGDPS